MLTLINSLTFDYQARKRIGGQHVSPYLLRNTAAVEPSALNVRGLSIPSVQANEVKTWVYDKPDLWENIWLIERTVASAYGLGAGELKLILDDFPGLRKKRQPFYQFLAQQLESWNAESGG